MPRVLVVDDEPDVVTLLRLLFEGAGYETVVPSSCEAAGDEAAGLRPDLILLDVRMPPTSGWEVMAKIRSNPLTRSVPIIMVSANAQVTERVRAIREGADDFVSKPFDGPELLARAERLRSRMHDRSGEGGSADLRGSLESYPLHILLQAAAQQRHSGTLEFRGGAEPSFIVFDEGSPVAARAGNLIGEEALWSLLERRSGQFSYSSGAPPASAEGQDLHCSVQSLLLDAAWIEDELSRRKHLLPGLEEPLFLREGEVYGIEEEARALVDVVRSALRSQPGRSLRQLLETVPMAAMRVRFAVSVLVDHDLLSERPFEEDSSLLEHPPSSPVSARSTGPSSICVLLTPEAVEEAQALLNGLPPEAVREGSLASVASPGGAHVALQHDDTSVDVWFFRFEMSSVAAIFGRAKQSSAVLLWADPESSELVIPPRLLAAAAGREAKLAVLNAGPKVKEKFGGAASRLDGAWKQIVAQPKSVRDLVRLAFAGSEVLLDELTAERH